MTCVRTFQFNACLLANFTSDVEPFYVACLILKSKYRIYTSNQVNDTNNDSKHYEGFENSTLKP